jgi:hypothetical protein
MNGITRFGLDASRLTIVFVTLVIAAGLLQFMEFPRQEDPPIVIREIVISAQFPGMKAEDVEQLITRQIETELRAMPEIDDIWSECCRRPCGYRGRVRRRGRDMAEGAQPDAGSRAPVAGRHHRPHRQR